MKSLADKIKQRARAEIEKLIQRGDELTEETIQKLLNGIIPATRNGLPIAWLVIL